MVAAALFHKDAVPFVTLLVGVGSLLIFLLPDAAHLLVYDRERVLAGEVWRLVSGHAVHFSWSHLGYNLALLMTAGWWLERQGSAGYVLLVALTALVAGLFFICLMPGMVRYGGLSGLVSAIVVYLSLHGMYYWHARPVWGVMLLLFAAKTGYEILVEESLFAAPGSAPFEVVPAVHIIGALVAVVLFYAFRRHRLVEGRPSLQGNP